MKDDFGYFGAGDEGYAQYKTAFDRNFGSDNSDRDSFDEGVSEQDGEEDF